jgi:uncharacterized protein
MAAKAVLKYINLFVDGRGHAGQIEEFTPPKFVMKMEEFRAGGMDAPTDIPFGMEKLEADFSLISYDRHVLTAFGLVTGAILPFQARTSLEDHDGTITSVIHHMRGRIREIDTGTLKAGDKPSMKVSLSLDYYKLVHGATTVHEIDPHNMLRIVNGVDQLAEHRRALGM